MKHTITAGLSCVNSQFENMSRKCIGLFWLSVAWEAGKKQPAHVYSIQHSCRIGGSRRQGRIPFPGEQGGFTRHAARVFCFSSNQPGFALTQNVRTGWEGMMRESRSRAMGGGALRGSKPAKSGGHSLSGGPLPSPETRISNAGRSNGFRLPCYGLQYPVVGQPNVHTPRTRSREKANMKSRLTYFAPPLTRSLGGNRRTLARSVVFRCIVLLTPGATALRYAAARSCRSSSTIISTSSAPRSPKHGRSRSRWTPSS